MPNSPPTVTEDGRVFTLADFATAAAMVGIKPNLLEVGIARGELPFHVVRLGPRGQRFIKSLEIVSWLEGQRTATPV